MGSPSRIRRALLAICLAGLLAAEIQSIDPADVAFRARATFRPHDLERDRIEGTDFLFDRPYGLFLSGVARGTPPGASIRLCAPSGNELYDFTAAYVLAPRAVARRAGGDFTAGYACPEPLPGGAPAGAGTLVPR
jgi:hypothetical protein